MHNYGVRAVLSKYYEISGEGIFRTLALLIRHVVPGGKKRFGDMLFDSFDSAINNCGGGGFCVDEAKNRVLVRIRAEKQRVYRGAKAQETFEFQR